MTLKLSTIKENKILWQMHSQAKRKTQMVYYVVFPFHNLTRWKKQG